MALQNSARCFSGVSCSPVLSSQGFEQGFGLLEVGGVKALSEPAIDRRQEVASFGAPVLLLPQAYQAHRCPQFQRFCLLAAGHVQSTLQPGFHLRLRCPRLPQEQDTPEAMDFRFPPAFLLLLHQGVGLGQRLDAVC
jgi:hypothetical protein